MKIHVMCVGYTLMMMITKKLELDVTVIVTNVDVGSIIGVQDLTKKTNSRKKFICGYC